MGTFQTFDHTADVGLAVRADSLADLLETAARATFQQMLEDLPDHVDVTREVCVAPAGDLAGDPGELLVEWLQDLLYGFETERLVPLECRVDAADVRHVRAHVGFGRFDPGRHRGRLEIKAVTYHGLEVRSEPDGRWSARFVLDV